MNDGRKRLSAPHVEGLAPYPAGKPIEELERELGISNVIKLASNENAFGASPRALAAAAQALANVHRYPDGNAYYLREALAATFDTPFDGVVTGNGSNDLIDLVVKAFISAASVSVSLSLGDSTNPTASSLRTRVITMSCDSLP